MENVVKEKLEVITSSELNLWVNVVLLDYDFESNEQFAQLITEHSGKYCSPNDIKNHFTERLWEDYELENRKQKYNIDKYAERQIYI